MLHSIFWNFMVRSMNGDGNTGRMQKKCTALVAHMFLSWPQRHHGKNYTAGHQTGDCEAEKFYKLALFAYLIFVKNNNNNISTFLEYFFLLVFIILAVFDKSVESWFWFVTPLNNF